MVFITVHNLVGIDAVVLIICMFFSISPVWRGSKILIHAPFGGGFEVKIGVTRNLLQFYRSRNPITWDSRLVNQTA